MEKIPYSKFLRGISDDAVVFYLQTEPVPSSTWLMVQHTVEENETSEFTSLRVGYGENVANVRWWEEHLVGVAGVLYWQDKEVHFVPEMNRVIFGFWGTTEEDVINCLVEGYMSPKILSRAPFRPRKRV